MYLDAYNLTRPMIDAAMGDCGHFKSHNVQARPHLHLAAICGRDKIR
jgi:hypothetical protein